MNLDRIAERAKAADRVIARIDEREANAQVSCGGESPKRPGPCICESLDAAGIHTTPQLNAGTTIEDLIEATERAEKKAITKGEQS